MSKRELKKDERRAVIVEAARTLMRARKAPGFSMRTLAEVAGVSVATPYNLFGSKQAIIEAVMDIDFQEFQHALMAEDKTPVEALFHTVSMASRLFEKEPGYYQSGAQALQGETNPALASHFGLPRHGLFRDLIARAVQDGYLIHSVNADTLAITLGQQFFGWITAWAKGQVSLEHLKARTHYAFALSLAGVATDQCRQDLQARALLIQDSLPESWQARTALASKSATPTSKFRGRS